MSDASMMLFEHTQKLASLQVPSTSISSPIEANSISEEIQEKTKREIRESRISTREKEKNEIATEMKSFMSAQVSQQQMNSILQMEGLKLLQHQYSQRGEPQLKERVEKIEEKMDLILKHLEDLKK